MKVNAEYLICENLSDKIELQYGTKIISINGVSIQDIVALILPFIPADGNNETRKHHALQRGFYRYYAYYFNSTSKEFKVVYENKLGQKSAVILAGISKTSLNKIRKIQEIDLSLIAPLTFEIKDHLSTGILTIRTFRSDRMENYNITFEDYITNCFKQLAQQQTKNLIIDLRGNGGGYSEYASTLFTFLTDSAFKYCHRQILTTDQLIKGVTYDIPATFEGFPVGAEKINGQYQWTTHTVLQWRQPSVFKFSGNIFFLIDGGCASTTSELASLARSKNIGTFIGEEVGGCYMGNTGGVLGWFELPNTKIRVRMGMVKFEMSNQELINKQGVQPDYKVTYTLDDVWQGRDLELALALKKIQEVEHR